MHSPHDVITLTSTSVQWFRKQLQSLSPLLRTLGGGNLLPLVSWKENEEELIFFFASPLFLQISLLPHFSSPSFHWLLLCYSSFPFPITYLNSLSFPSQSDCGNSYSGGQWEVWQWSLWCCLSPAPWKCVGHDTHCSCHWVSQNIMQLNLYRTLSNGPIFPFSRCWKKCVLSFPPSSRYFGSPCCTDTWELDLSSCQPLAISVTVVVWAKMLYVYVFFTPLATNLYYSSVSLEEAI